MRVIKFGFCVLFALNSMLVFSQDELEDKREADKEKGEAELVLMREKFAKKLPDLKEFANDGNVQAMISLGRIYCNGVLVDEDFQEGIKWLDKAALKGNAKDLYQLGMVYKNGIPPLKNPKKALECLEKSAKGGNDMAWYSWGVMYKNGEGVPQDYSKAMEIFREGSEHKNPKCFFGQGYLYYKGFGCAQDYEKAVELFEKGSELDDRQSMYMLGLCYKNGYGIEMDFKKANLLFVKSNNSNSNKELARPKPENANPNQTKTVSKPIPELDVVAIPDVPSTFQKIKQKPFAKNSSGRYKGYMMIYDYSGQNLIEKTPVEMEIVEDGKIMTGKCKLEGQELSYFTGEIQDKSIVFKNSLLGVSDYYSKQKFKIYELEEAKLQQLEYNGSEFIVGNLELYGSKELERYKPMYLVLEKSK
ncbi:MAG TPA: tetratricopeptide repeat protein [Flavobacterium sp.]